MYIHPLEGIVPALRGSFCPKPLAKEVLAVKPAGFQVGLEASGAAERPWDLRGIELPCK